MKEEGQEEEENENTKKKKNKKNKKNKKVEEECTSSALPYAALQYDTAATAKRASRSHSMFAKEHQFGQISCLFRASLFAMHANK